MKISLNWLQDFLRIDETPSQVADDLSMLGLPVDSVEHIEDDVVLDVDVTANRPDCLSHIGVARDLAAFYGEDLNRTAFQLENLPEKAEMSINIEIDSPKLCRRYCGIVLRGAKICHSPEWMRKRLQAIGQRPINNIVDITNYVLHELGHPLHAFDYSKIRDGHLIVRTAKKDEKLVTLDGQERKLGPGMLLITDKEAPLAIAGVIGGENSEVDDSTTEILIESAWFEPASIRQTSRDLGLSTEASFRFERGADIEVLPLALARAVKLMIELAGARVASPLIDVYPLPPELREISLRAKQIERLVGAKIDEKFVERLFPLLEFKIRSKSIGEWIVQPPSFRVDVSVEADLIEEVARYYGYNKLPSTLPMFKGNPVERKFAEERDGARFYFKERGFQEILTTSFTDMRKQASFVFYNYGDPVKVDNPLADEEPFLRMNLLGTMVGALKFNENNFNESARLFEVGRVYYKDGNNYVEKTTLSIGAYGGYTEAHWSHVKIDFDFFLFKGIIEDFLKTLGLKYWEVENASDIPFMHPGISAKIKAGGKIVGTFGRLNDILAGDMKFHRNVFIGELILDEIFPLCKKTFKFIPVSKFPDVDRDVSFSVDKAVSFSKIEKTIKTLKIPELHGIKLIDLYKGKDVPQDKRAMTIRLIFNNSQRTLTDEEVDALRDRVTKALVKRYRIEFR